MLTKTETLNALPVGSLVSGGNLMQDTLLPRGTETLSISLTPTYTLNVVGVTRSTKGTRNFITRT